jgi:hypothetical protein
MLDACTKDAARYTSLCFAAAIALLGNACGSGGEEQGGVLRGLSPDGGGPVDCPVGEHECDGTCTPDGDNSPEGGCATGCGVACDSPASGMGVATCSQDGTCDFECDEGYERLGGDCVCAAQVSCETLGRECGSVPDGCGGAMDCGACGDGSTCNANGTCGGCDADDAEPNETQESGFDLGEYADSPKSGEDWSLFGISDEFDNDWFIATVKDKFGVLNPGNPDVRVTLGGVPSGDDYELAVWYVCDSGSGEGGGHSCDEGTDDTAGGNACLANTGAEGEAVVKVSTTCNGSNESGTVAIRVRANSATGTCAAYSLAINVD